jgi:hypothetical protein
VPTALDNGRRSPRKLLTRRRRSAARAETAEGLRKGGRGLDWLRPAAAAYPSPSEQRVLMGGKATWLITAAVAAVVIVGVVDALRGSSSHHESAHAAQAPTVVDLGGATLTLESVSAQAATEPMATTEPQGTTDTAAIPSPPPERLPRCTMPQLVLAVKIVDGSAMLVLRRVAGEPCHHGQPGFVQLMQIPYTESCDPAGSYLAVATVGPYEARRTVSGTEIVCNHG